MGKEHNQPQQPPLPNHEDAFQHFVETLEKSGLIDVFQGILPEDIKAREEALQFMYLGTAVTALLPGLIHRPLAAIMSDAKTIDELNRLRARQTDEYLH